METTKYGKLIPTVNEAPSGRPEWIEKVPRDPDSGKILVWMDGDVIPGAFYYEGFMALKPNTRGRYNDPPHVHEDWDEVIGIFGTNPADPFDLGGEVQLTLGDEVHSITKTCSIFVPRGLKHCPLVIKKVSTPILLVTTGASKNYVQTLASDWKEQLG